MNPYRLKNVFEYLTSNNQLLKKKLKLGTSEIPIPPKRKDVIDIEAINRFNKANPRVDTTSLKPLSVKHSNVRQSNVNEPNEGAIQSAFDTATRDAQFEGYPAPSYDKFKSRYLKKNMKADGGRMGYKDGEGVITIDDKIDEMISFYKDYLKQGGKMNFQTFSKKYIPENFADGGRIGYKDGPKFDVQASGTKSGKQQIQGAPDGITSDKETINAILTMDIPLTEKVNLIGDLQYGKYRDKIEYNDDEIFLDDPKSYRNRNIGLDYNRGGEGFSGSATVGDEGPEFKIKYKKSFADGGSIGGGRITGTPIGDRTGFANIFLDQGKKSRFSKNSNTVVVNGKEYLKVSKKGDPNFGKYVYRTSVATPGYGKSGKSKNEYLTLTELNKRVNSPKTGKAEFKNYSKGYLAEIEDIKKLVAEKGAKNIYLSDLVEQFGDVTKSSSDEVRDPTTEKKIKRAIGDLEYKKLIKGGDRLKTINEKRVEYNKLVRDVKRGDRPLMDLTSAMTKETPNTFKNYLNPTERRMYQTMSSQIKAIQSRVLQPRQAYEGTNAIKEIREATTKTFNKIVKKYPQAQSARNVLTSGKGIVAYNGKTYVLSQLYRHVQNGGTKYRYVSGDTTATIKFRNTETGRMISLNNIDVNDPEFKEAVDAYNEKEKIMNTEIDDPRKKGSKIKIGQAIAANGDSVVIDHLDDVKNNPLKNLSITNQKANMAATIKGVTESELDSIGRGLKLSTEDNIKRYSNYAKRLLINQDNPDKIKTGPKETIFKKEGTLRGVTNPPDIEIKRLVAALGGGTCSVFSGTKSPALKADGGRIGLATGTPNIDDCFNLVLQL